MLRDIVEDVVSAQPDMELVGRGVSDLATTIKAQQPDVVVVAEAWACLNLPGRELLVDDRWLRVLVVIGDGRQAQLFELRRIPIHEVSPQGLVNAIRAAVSVDGADARGGPGAGNEQ
jgi:hypothetical protein